MGAANALTERRRAPLRRATLRRLLDSRAHRDRQRVATLLRELIGAAAVVSGAPPKDSVGIQMETKVEFGLPFSRTFWCEPQQFAAVDLIEMNADEDRRAAAFRALAQMRRLNWRAMRGRIAKATDLTGSITLSQLLAAYPPEAGAIEVLGYLQIARDDGHIVREDVHEELVLPATKAGGRPMFVTLPLVTFTVNRKSFR